jgi:phosphoglycerate dehydrogenase-like enzyme
MEFSQMPPGSYLINISRGGIVNEEALITALNEGKIAGACLDVFSQEPLPHDSPLFKTKNLLITPHIAGNYPQYTEDVINLFLDNLKRYLQGDRLRNRINLKRGY